MQTLTRAKKSARAIGSATWVVWGALHIWVGAEGVHQYLTGGTRGLWNMVIGGHLAPRETFEHTTDPATAYAQGQLILNFCLDVGGYGVLALIIAWMIWKRESWWAYFIGLFVVGIADLSFLFALVTAGVIEASVPTIIGPILWLVACVVTPFGLSTQSK
ncbi:MAG: hypothetical protein KJS97_11285 [Alphaproteobacteria bacterium]|nr:hypothetical protein [Alphaproteobacteria bacterium]